MQVFFDSFESIKDNIPIYLIIDEYDHFTNEILIRDLTEFKSSVFQNGYVRKFYETIKIQQFSVCEKINIKSAFAAVFGSNGRQFSSFSATKLLKKGFL
mgnify:CR=1 FL=1